MVTPNRVSRANTRLLMMSPRMSPDYGLPPPLSKTNSTQLLFPPGSKSSLCLSDAVALIIYISNPASSALKKCFPERIFQNARAPSFQVGPSCSFTKDSHSFPFYPFLLQGEEFPSLSSLRIPFHLLGTFSGSAGTRSRVTGFIVSDDETM